MMKRIAAIAALAVLGSVSAFAAKPVPPPPAPTPLVVVDATGKLVGRYGSTHASASSVFLTVSGVLVAMPLYWRPELGQDPSKLYYSPTAAVELVFEDQWCQGVPYMITFGSTAFGVTPSAVSHSEAGTPLLYVASGPTVEKSFYSRRLGAGSCGPIIATYAAVPVSAPVDLNALYLQPFVIR